MLWFTYILQNVFIQIKIHITYILLYQSWWASSQIQKHAEPQTTTWNNSLHKINTLYK
jgi:hypothetical protein